MTTKNQDRAASRFITAIIFAGILVFIAACFHLQPIPDLFIFCTLVGFFFITSFYPIPIWKGLVSLGFPLIYTMDLLYGWGIAAIVFGSVILIIALMNQRPFPLLVFNPSQLVISFIGAVWVSDYILNKVGLLEGVWYAEWRIILVTFLYFILNNLIVDIVLFIRSEPYPVQLWKTKWLSELLVTFFSILYLTLMIVLGSQNRGIVDVFSFIFFFSPLVAVAVISSFISRLQRERNRLRALYEISTKFNQHLPSKDWLEQMEQSFVKFLETDEVKLFLFNGQKWLNGYGNDEDLKQFDLLHKYLTQIDIETPVKLFHKKSSAETDWAFSLLKPSMKSVMYSLLFNEDEVSGLLIAGRTRPHSFTQRDTQSMATLANQVAIVWKTKLLISEREKRVLLEERNRIAREIHDGIAQTLAGSVMQLETAQRVFEKKPEKTRDLVETSTEKLRISLKELRDSIYALRPYPTERVGLIQAIQSKIRVVKKDTSGLVIHFQERGAPRQLSTMVEKVIFDIFQESLQNTVKHAGASKVDVLLSYTPDQILLKIKDNGKGFSLYESMIKARNEPHYGILNMNERAESLGAILHIESVKGKGTEIRLQVPNLEPKEATIND